MNLQNNKAKFEFQIADIRIEPLVHHIFNNDIHHYVKFETDNLYYHKTTSIKAPWIWEDHLPGLFDYETVHSHQLNHKFMNIKVVMRRNRLMKVLIAEARIDLHTLVHSAENRILFMYESSAEQNLSLTANLSTSTHINSSSTNHRKPLCKLYFRCTWKEKLTKVINVTLSDVNITNVLRELHRTSKRRPFSTVKVFSAITFDDQVTWNEEPIYLGFKEIDQHFNQPTKVKDYGFVLDHISFSMNHPHLTTAMFLSGIIHLVFGVEYSKDSRQVELAHVIIPCLGNYDHKNPKVMIREPILYPEQFYALFTDEEYNECDQQEDENVNIIEKTILDNKKCIIGYINFENGPRFIHLFGNQAQFTSEQGSFGLAVFGFELPKYHPFDHVSYDCDIGTWTQISKLNSLFMTEGYSTTTIQNFFKYKKTHPNPLLIQRGYQLNLFQQSEQKTTMLQTINLVEEQTEQHTNQSINEISNSNLIVQRKQRSRVPVKSTSNSMNQLSDLSLTQEHQQQIKFTSTEPEIFEPLSFAVCYFREAFQENKRWNTIIRNGNKIYKFHGSTVGENGNIHDEQIFDHSEKMNFLKLHISKCLRQHYLHSHSIKS